MRTPPLISVGCFVHYWVSHAIIKYFEVLAYVLPHFDAIIHMLIRGSSTFIFQTLRSAILSSWSIHLLQVCWIFLKRTYFKSLLKVYDWSVFAKIKIFQSVHLSKVSAAVVPQSKSTKLCSLAVVVPQSKYPRCKAQRCHSHFIMTCDTFGTRQMNILGLCYLFGKTYKQPTIAVLKSLKSTHSTKLLHLLRRTIRYH